MEILLKTYIALVKSDGLVVIDNQPRTAHSWILNCAIKEHGLDAVKAATLPILPELIKTTRDEGVRIFSGDVNYEKGLAAAYQAFFDAYQRGEVVEIESGLKVKLHEGKAIFVK